MGVISDYILRDLPRPAFLSGKRIAAFLRGLTQVGDKYAQQVIDSRNEHTAEKATHDALLALARNMNDRGFACEDDRLLMQYLLRIIAEHRKKGTTDGIKTQFARIGCPNIEIVTELDLRNAGAVNPFGGNIGFFFILVNQPHPMASVGGGAWDGGESWDDGVTRWGWNGTQDDLSEISDILRRWKPSGTSCRFVVFDDDGSAAWAAGGLTGNYSLIAFNESWEKAPTGLVSYYYNSSFLVA